MLISLYGKMYERLYPVYDNKVYNGSVAEPYNRPKAPVHLLVGSAGCPEYLDPFNPYPKPWSAKRISEYGVTEMIIFNKTHIRFRQRSTVQVGNKFLLKKFTNPKKIIISLQNGKLIDAFTLVKGNWN